MGGTCSTYGEVRGIQDFGGEPQGKRPLGNPRERDHLETPGVDGRILRWVFRKWDGWAWT